MYNAATASGGWPVNAFCQSWQAILQRRGYQDPGSNVARRVGWFSIACSIVFVSGFCLLFCFFAFLWVAHLVIPGVDTQVTAVGHGVLQFRAINGTSVRRELATEVRIVIRAGLVEGSNIAVASSPLAVGLGVVGIQVVTTGESSVAAGHPADMGLFLGMALHVALQMLLALETTLATRLLALELDLLDDGWQVLEAQVGAHKLLLRRLARRLTVAQQTIVIHRGDRELFLVLVATGNTADWSVTSRGCAQGDRAHRCGRSVRLKGVEVGREVRVGGRRRSDGALRKGLGGSDGLGSERLI